MIVMKIGIVDMCWCDIVFDILSKGLGCFVIKLGIFKIFEIKKY